MAISKNDLKTAGRFDLADPSTLDTFDEWALWLEAILHGPVSIFVRDSGEEVLSHGKQLVERLDGLRITIYPNELPPPHFLVEAPDVDASFAIEDCRVVGGKPTQAMVQKIRFWHRRAKPTLIEVWNETRPVDCTVGQYGVRRG